MRSSISFPASTLRGVLDTITSERKTGVLVIYFQDGKPSDTSRWTEKIDSHLTNDPIRGLTVSSTANLE
jgi:hypothetical protein